MKIENLQLEEALNATVYVTSTELNFGGGSQGATGPMGPTGSQGNDGSAGPMGPTGAQGNNGSVGAMGPTGAQGNNGSVGPTGPTGSGSNFPDGTSNGNYIFWDTTSEPAAWTIGSNTVTIGQDAGKINAPKNAVLIGHNAGYINILSDSTFVVGKGVDNTIYYSVKDKWAPFENISFSQCNAVSSTLIPNEEMLNYIYFAGTGPYAIAVAIMDTNMTILSTKGFSQNIIGTGECVYIGKQNSYFGGTRGQNDVNSVIYINTPPSYTGVKDSANMLSTCYSISTYESGINTLIYFAGTPTTGLGATGCVYTYSTNTNTIASLNNTLLQTCYKITTNGGVIASGESSDGNVFNYYNSDSGEWQNIPVLNSDESPIFTVVYDFVSAHINTQLIYVLVGSNENTGIIAYGVGPGLSDITWTSIPGVFTTAGKSVVYNTNQGRFEAVGYGSDVDSNTFAYSTDGLTWTTEKVDTLQRGLGLSVVYNGIKIDNIAIGTNAGSFNQGYESIAIGKNAGMSGQGNNAIAIGTNAGVENQAPYSIILNATQESISAADTGFYVNPISSNNRISPPSMLTYDISTTEIKYTNINTENTFTQMLTLNDSGDMNLSSITESAIIPNVLSYNTDAKTMTYSPLTPTPTFTNILSYDSTKGMTYTEITQSTTTPNIVSYGSNGITYTPIIKSSTTPTEMLTYDSTSKTVSYSSIGYTGASNDGNTHKTGTGPVYLVNNTDSSVKVFLGDFNTSDVSIGYILPTSQVFIPQNLAWFTQTGITVINLS